jgi:hypothetical protein
MRWLAAALRELFGLFVDDVPFTLAILAWVAVAVLALPRLAIDPRWDAPLLGLGCALLLLLGALRAARRHWRRAAGRQ